MVSFLTFFFPLQTVSGILLSAPKKHLLVVPSCASRPENSRKCIKYFQADEPNVNKYHMCSTRVSGSAAGGDEPRRIADNSCQVCVCFLRPSRLETIQTLETDSDEINSTHFRRFPRPERATPLRNANGKRESCDGAAAAAVRQLACSTDTLASWWRQHLYKYSLAASCSQTPSPRRLSLP